MIPVDNASLLYLPEHLIIYYLKGLDKLVCRFRLYKKHDIYDVLVLCKSKNQSVT